MSQKEEGVIVFGYYFIGRNSQSGINKDIKIKAFYAIFTVTDLIYLIYNPFKFPIHPHIVKFLGIM